MQLPTITQLVTSPHPVSFVRYQDRTLWYRALYPISRDPDECLTFEFPISDTESAGATFLVEDKPIFFMRWMRKHLEFLQKSLDIADGKCPAPPQAAAPRIGPWPAGSR